MFYYDVRYRTTQDNQEYYRASLSDQDTLCVIGRLCCVILWVIGLMTMLYYETLLSDCVLSDDASEITGCYKTLLSDHDPRWKACYRTL